MESSKTINLDECTDGMRLADGVIDENGMMLVSADTPINDKLLAKLANLGVENVTIIVEEQLSDEEKLRLQKEIEEQVNDRFRNVADNPLMQQLRDAIIQFRIDEVSK